MRDPQRGSQVCYDSRCAVWRPRGFQSTGQQPTLIHTHTHTHCGLKHTWQRRVRGNRTGEIVDRQGMKPTRQDCQAEWVTNCMGHFHIANLWADTHRAATPTSNQIWPMKPHKEMFCLYLQWFLWFSVYMWVFFYILLIIFLFIFNCFQLKSYLWHLWKTVKISEN